MQANVIAGSLLHLVLPCSYKTVLLAAGLNCPCYYVLVDVAESMATIDPK